MQEIYRGWSRLGFLVAVEFAAMVAVVALWRHERAVLRPAVVAILCLLAAQAVFWLWTSPANQATANWTTAPAHWQALRRQWEYSHLAGAGLQLLAMSALIVAALAYARAGGRR